jgi:hypothetical protein
MLTSLRDSRTVGDSVLYYIVKGNKSRKDKLVEILESSAKVDGIGGIVWEGALVMCEILKKCNADTTLLIELGAGTGLCGIVGAAMGMDTIVTDREVDLAEENIQHNVSKRILTPSLGRIEVAAFDWAEGMSGALLNSSRSDKRKVIIGVEVACLLKQQPYLVEALSTLYDPGSIILITFDIGTSKYESAFLEKMRREGFLAKDLYAANVVFETFSPLLLKENMLLNVPPPVPTVKRTYGIVEESSDGDTVESLCCVGHKVVIFYKQSAVNTCCNCNSQFFGALNNKTSCRTHYGYFVCRKHPAETRLSVDGCGDGLGYYGNGEEGKK